MSGNKERRLVKGFSFLVANVRSIFHKQDLLSSWAFSCSGGILILTETLLMLDISKNELTLSCNYSVFRKDGIAKKGGGVLIAVKNALHMLSHDYSHDMEAISVRIQAACSSILIVACYSPPTVFTTS